MKNKIFFIIFFLCLGLISKTYSLELDFKNSNKSFEGTFKDVSVKNLLYFITSQIPYNFIIDVEEDKKISVTFKNITIKEALQAIIKYAELEAIKLNDNTIMIVPKNKAHLYKQKQILSIKLIYTPADYVRNIIYSREKDSTIMVDNFSNSLIIETTADKIKDLSQLIKFFDKPDSEVKTKTFKLNNSKAKDILTIINNSVYIFQEPIIKEQIKIDADERTNSIIVTAPYFIIKNIEELLSSLIDKKLPQIMIEVQVVEINKDRFKDLGIYPGESSNITTLLEKDPSSTGASSNTSVILTVKSDKISFPVRTSINLQVLMLEKQGVARILANPKLVTSDGKTAKVFLGERVPYLKPTIIQSGQITQAFQEIEYVDVGVNLEFQPLVTKDNYINLKILPKVSYLITTTPAPWTATREVSTELTVKSNDTIIIAGLIKEEERKINYKIPIVGDIPLVGSLFKAEKKSNQNTEVIFIIRPQIINLPDDTINQNPNQIPDQNPPQNPDQKSIQTKSN